MGLQDDAAMPDPNASSGDPAPARAKPTIDASLQQEIDSALAGMSIDEMFDDAGPAVRAGGSAPGLRTTRRGTIVRIHSGDVFVEFGPKSQASARSRTSTSPPPPARPTSSWSSGSMPSKAC